MSCDLMRELRRDAPRRSEETSGLVQGPSRPRGDRFDNWVAVNIQHHKESCKRSFSIDQVFRFVLNFVNFYDNDSQNSSFHAVGHLCEQVRRGGPLRRNSDFAFESVNQFLLSSVQGTLKNLTHVFDLFLLRQKTASKRIGTLCSMVKSHPFQKKNKAFSMTKCGPGKLESKYFF